MSAESRERAHLPVLFLGVDGRIWLNVGATLKPVKDAARVRTFALRPLDADELRLVRRYLDDTAIELWAKLTT